MEGQDSMNNIKHNSSHIRRSMPQFALLTACEMLSHYLMPQLQDQNNATIVVQQDGAP
jgi:hypothetical protein